MNLEKQLQSFEDVFMGRMIELLLIEDFTLSLFLL